MTKKSKIFISVICLLGITAAFCAAYYYCTYYKSNITTEKNIYIYKHYTYQQTLDTLCSSGAFKNNKSFIRAAKSKDFNIRFKPGKYTLKEGMDNNQVITTITNGWQTPAKIVLSGNIMRLENLASSLGRQFEADSAAFMQVLTDKNLTDSLGFDSYNIIGMFILNTYELYWTTSPEKVMLRFKKEYDRFWNKDRIAKAKKINLSSQEVMTMASIVVGETNHVPEQPTVAGVYLNRIKKRMRLQADPTIRYVAIIAEPDIKRILKKHLKIESPYNTYKHYGLPPGPIAIPTMSSIEAVLNYEKHNYLYFCANSNFDGTHLFASSYSQHLKNARKFHKALTKKLASNK